MKSKTGTLGSGSTGLRLIVNYFIVGYNLCIAFFLISVIINNINVNILLLLCRSFHVV